MKIQREVAVLDEACNSASCLSGEYNSENAGDSVVAVVDPPHYIFVALARQLPSEMKIIKTSPAHIYGENCISWEALGRGFRGGERVSVTRT